MEFEKFFAIMKQIIDMKMKVTDKNGVVHEEQFTAEELKQFKELGEKAAPYFAKVKGGK
ncbi:hypothetical protein BFO01nite_54100 [Brevibacillus formosus]|uniref:DUF3600 domain-containing protein n=1 Tax=Brevibacillus formosus TaxID=54913 RepID=A0ABQ0TDA0_9BACL|nr:hypothetical protein BFO01nite_54100 [Brevibacillus formosus]